MKFLARVKQEFPNGAIGYAPGGMMDCLGPFAKVQNCSIAGFPELPRYTCYATGYADTAFSVPACTRIMGKHVSGFFSLDDGAVEFRPHWRHYDHLVQCVIKDRRYTVNVEGCGEPYAVPVVRFCGEWVSKAESGADALRIIRAHHEKLFGFPHHSNQQTVD